jgi:VanZ family protein
MTSVAPSRDALVRLWLPVIVWAGVIFWLSATPNLRIASADNVDFVVRKAGHMGAFGVLAVLLWRVLAPAPWRLRGPALWGLAWVLTVAYAASDECHQSFTAGRHPSLTDVGIDAAGAALFLVALAVWLQWWRGRATG